MGFIQSNHSVIFYNNTMISFNMLEAARQTGVKRCVRLRALCPALAYSRALSRPLLDNISPTAGLMDIATCLVAAMLHCECNACHNYYH